MWAELYGAIADALVAIDPDLRVNDDWIEDGTNVFDDDVVVGEGEEGD